MTAADKAPEPRISVKGLNLHYGSHHALKNINVKINRNSITALIGPSGCGKSTFLRCLNRMNDMLHGVKPQGQVVLDGKDILKTDVDVVQLRKKVGMVFQQPNPFHRSIFENVAYGPRIHGTRGKSELDNIVEESLRRAALWDEVKDNVHKSAMALSGGQQQRLCIARVLAMKPEVVLMDEPCSALDPLSTLRIEELVQALKKDFTIVIVTHNMQQASRISDYTGFFLMGELIEYDESTTIFTRPSDERTEGYVTGRFG